jgi:hypothetical protein
VRELLEGVIAFAVLLGMVATLTLVGLASGFVGYLVSGSRDAATALGTVTVSMVIAAGLGLVFYWMRRVS